MLTEEEIRIATTSNEHALFDMVRARFESEVKMHVDRLGLNGEHAEALQKRADDLCNVVSAYRSSPERLALSIAQIEENLNHLNIGQIIWRTENFITYPIQLAHDAACELRGLRERVSFESSGPDSRITPAHMARMQGYISIFQEPGTIVAAGYALHKHGTFEAEHQRPPVADSLRDEYRDYFRTVLASQFDAGLIDEDDMAILGPFVEKLKHHVGDIDGLAGVIGEALLDPHPSVANSRAFYVDPFYKVDPKMEFPSAQADFVAARFLSGCYEEAR